MADKDAVELYRKHRPTAFADVLGQADAIQSLRSMRETMPHAILFTGPSGTGKTTLARILAGALKCSGNDLEEMNASDCRGIDEIRGIRERLGFAPMGGNCRVIIVDECHGLTTDAQDAFLKLLEDTPPHIYFMLCTTNPGKLKKTIVTRCHQVVCKPLSKDDILTLLRRTAAAENKVVEEEVLVRIADAADGSARKAMVFLHGVINLTTVKEKLEIICKGDPAATGFEIAQALMRDNVKWTEVANLLTTAEEEPESIRRVILGFAQSTLLRSGKPKANRIIMEFREPLYDIGKPGLVSACFNVVTGK